MRTILLLLMGLGWSVFVEAQGVKGLGGETPRVETPRRHGERGLNDALPRPRGDGYVGSEACRTCHGKEHESWYRTYHRTMTAPARGEVVKGLFDGTRVQVSGLEYRVYREGDRYMVEMPDPDAMMYIVQGGRKVPLDRVTRVRLPVVMTTGSHHYQTYWVESPRHPGLMQTVPLVYLISEKRWIPREAAFMRGPEDREPLVTQWNHHCIRCHSTGGNPGLNEATGQLETQVGELGISCEACHGPGEAHGKRMQAHLGSALSSKLTKKVVAADVSILNPSTLASKKSTEVCGQCHGVYVIREEYGMEYAKAGPLFHPGEELLKTRFYPQPPRVGATEAERADYKRNEAFFRELWWPDGTILAGGREYTGLLASGCYSRGEMSCLSCHSMHSSDPNDQLKPGMDGPSACVKCHTEPKYTSRIMEHTRHAVGSEGSNCLNCHMPYTSYALFKAIRSHQIGSPSYESSVRYGVPNACNLCHLDKSLDWAGRELARRRGVAEPSEPSKDGDVSAFLVWILRGDAAQRAIAAWHAGWEPALKASGSGWQAPFLARLLDDPYPVVRHIAGERIRGLKGYGGIETDFLATADVRKLDVERALARWTRATVDRVSPSVLLLPDGKVMEDRLRELLGRRDNRSVTIKE